MITDPAQSLQSRSIQIVGNAPGAYLLATILETQGLRFTFDRSSERPALSLVTNSSQLTGDWLYADLPCTTRRHLAEQTWTDHQSLAFGQILIKSVELQSVAPGTEDPAAFVVNFSKRASVGGGSNSVNTAIVVELIWNCPDVPVALVYLSGEHLDEFNASASVASGHGMTSLALAAPMETITNHSIAAVDVLWRLLDHPGIADLIPQREPDNASEVIMRTSPTPYETRYSGSRLDICLALNMLDHRSIDAECAVAEELAQVIEDAAAENRWSLAHFSRIMCP